jgi:hypothetical protein
VAVKQSVDEMEIARPTASCTYSKLPSQMSFRTRGEGCRLLVSGMDPLDVAAFTEGFRQPVQAVANDAVNALDTGGMQNLGKNVSDLGFHNGLPADTTTDLGKN